MMDCIRHLAARISGMGAGDIALALVYAHAHRWRSTPPAVARKISWLWLSGLLKLTAGAALGRLVGWPTESQEAQQPPPKAEE